LLSSHNPEQLLSLKILENELFGALEEIVDFHFPKRLQEKYLMGER